MVVSRRNRASGFRDSVGSRDHSETGGLALVRAPSERTPDLIALLAEDSTVRGMSDAAAELLGLAPGAVGVRLADLVVDRHADSLRTFLGEARQRPRTSRTVECQLRATGQRWCVLELLGTRHDDVRVAAGVPVRLSDVTDQKQVEQALHQRSEMLAALSDAAPVAIVVESSTGEVQLWSAAAESLFGWRASEVVGRPNPLVPDDRRQEHAQLRARVLCGERFSKIETVRLHLDGSPRPVTMSTALLRDRRGDPSGVVEILDEATPR